MNTKKTLSMIDSLREGWYNPPMIYEQKRIDFVYQSYQRSALDEIKMYLMEHKNEDPIAAIEDFRYMMDQFACDAKNGSANFMFSIYYDVTTDVLDALLGMR